MQISYRQTSMQLHRQHPADSKQVSLMHKVAMYWIDLHNDYRNMNWQHCIFATGLVRHLPCVRADCAVDLLPLSRTPKHGCQFPSPAQIRLYNMEFGSA